MSLSSRVVVVTGAASGIGAATAGLARAQGAEVVHLDRNVPAGADGTWIQVDLADPGSIEAAVAQLPAAVDALCNVAGVPGTLPAETVLGVNLLGLRHLTELVVDRAAGRPLSVVHVASVAGMEWPTLLEPIGGLLATETFQDGLDWYASNSPEQPVYNFGKAALIVYAMRTAWEWRGRGVRVNSVSPGPIETPILPDFRASMGEETLDGVALLVGRNGQPDEVAPAICFLADPASSWVNGTNIVVDGGFSAALASSALDLAALAGTGGN